MLTTKELTDAAWSQHPFTYRNNRGIFKVVGRNGNTRIIRCGIPEPRGKESESDYKGGDRIGWTNITITPDMVGQQIAVFTSIEIKGPEDELIEGQIKWHNLVIQHGGISEIWTPKKTITEAIT